MCNKNVSFLMKISSADQDIQCYLRKNYSGGLGVPEKHSLVEWWGVGCMVNLGRCPPNTYCAHGMKKRKISIAKSNRVFLLQKKSKDSFGIPMTYIFNLRGSISATLHFASGAKSSIMSTALFN